VNEHHGVSEVPLQAGGDLVFFRAGALVVAIAANDVSETMRPLPVDRIAGMPEYVLGLAVVRGRPTPVIDASRVLGARDAGPPRRFIVLRVGARAVALAVEAVLAVAPAARERLESFPSLLGDAGSDLVASIGRRDADLLVVLRGARIVADPVWRALEAERQHA
jgi:purine-binding chemotaxis protein CheW